MRSNQFERNDILTYDSQMMKNFEDQFSLPETVVSSKEKITQKEKIDRNVE